MQVIAIGKMKELLQANLKLLDNPVLLITSEYYAGCPNCNSDATIFRPELLDRKSLGETEQLHQVTNHKFPFDVFIKIPENGEIPTRIVVGTRPAGTEFELVIRQITY
jgi:hypothetical protein